MRRRFLLLLFIFILAGCGSSGGNAAVPTDIPSSSSFAPPTNTSEASHHWQIGDVVKLDTWEITVTQAKEIPDQVNPTLVSLLIALTMQNATSSIQVAKPLSFTLRDQQGNVYDSKRPLPDGYADASGTVPNHSQVQGWLGFEVPPGQHQFTLNFDNHTTTIVWDISVFTDVLW